MSPRQGKKPAAAPTPGSPGTPDETKGLSLRLKAGVVLTLADAGLLVFFSQAWGDGPAYAALMAFIAVSTRLFVWGGLGCGVASTIIKGHWGRQP